MQYENNKTAYQDEEWFDREQRNVFYGRNWNRDLRGQTFYQICGDNKNLCKEVIFKNNWITDGELDAMLSEPIKALPTLGMKPAPEGALRKALRVKLPTLMT